MIYYPVSILMLADIRVIQFILHCLTVLFDTAPHDSLSEVSTFSEVMEKRQGLKVVYLKSIAYCQGWITAKQLRENALPMLKNDYGKYLLSILEEKDQTLKKNLEY